ncbi:MAG: hypothetical protein MH252_07140 [Thermosynechococcaceae cyanobacterium MS004]|nr:hypothetical protein [Thermosynechococcaceae cyanobacterium MS004]
MVKGLGRAAELENFYRKRGKHTFASRLIEDGMDAYLAMQLTRDRSARAFKTHSNKGRYQAAKTAYLKGQGEKEREAQSLEQILEGLR